MARPRILFVVDHPWERPAKLAYALGQRGYSVALIYVSPPNNFEPLDYFDHVIQARTPYEALAVAHRMAPQLIHLFSYGADPLAALLMRNKVGKIIYDYKDCFEGLSGAAAPPEVAEEQRRLVEEADGLVCRDLQLWNYCRVNGIQAQRRKLLFYDYCWGLERPPVQQRRDGEVHTVLAGNFAVEKVSPRQADSGYLHVARALVKAGVHVHFYPRWHYKYLEQRSDFDDYFELAEQSPLCHIHAAVPMQGFVAELNQYDYGLGIYQGALFNGMERYSCTNGHEGHGVAARWFDYLDAGLDILASPALRTGYRLMRQVDAVFPAHAQLFADGSLKGHLLARMGEYKQLRLDAARKRYDILNHIDRLIAFYGEVLNSPAT